MNAYTAEDYLREHSRTPIFLLRFSRLHPELLTLSILKNGVVSHTRKPLDTSIDAFLKTKGLSNSARIPLQLDWIVLEKTETLSGYIEKSSSYVTWE